jgi:hypothetical protein
MSTRKRVSSNTPATTVPDDRSKGVFQVRHKADACLQGRHEDGTGPCLRPFEGRLPERPALGPAAYGRAIRLSLVDGGEFWFVTRDHPIALWRFK